MKIKLGYFFLVICWAWAASLVQSADVWTNAAQLSVSISRETQIPTTDYDSGGAPLFWSINSLFAPSFTLESTTVAPNWNSLQFKYLYAQIETDSATFNRNQKFVKDNLRFFMLDTQKTIVSTSGTRVVLSTNMTDPNDSSKIVPNTALLALIAQNQQFYVYVYGTTSDIIVNTDLTDQQFQPIIKFTVRTSLSSFPETNGKFKWRRGQNDNYVCDPNQSYTTDVPCGIFEAKKNGRIVNIAVKDSTIAKAENNFNIVQKLVRKEDLSAAQFQHPEFYSSQFFDMTMRNKFLNSQTTQNISTPTLDFDVDYYWLVSLLDTYNNASPTLMYGPFKITSSKSIFYSKDMPPSQTGLSCAAGIISGPKTIKEVGGIKLIFRLGFFFGILFLFLAGIKFYLRSASFGFRRFNRRARAAFSFFMLLSLFSALPLFAAEEDTAPLEPSDEQEEVLPVDEEEAKPATVSPVLPVAPPVNPIEKIAESAEPVLGAEPKQSAEVSPQVPPAPTPIATVASPVPEASAAENVSSGKTEQVLVPPVYVPQGEVPNDFSKSAEKSFSNSEKTFTSNTDISSSSAENRERVRKLKSFNFGYNYYNPQMFNNSTVPMGGFTYNDVFPDLNASGLNSRPLFTFEIGHNFAQNKGYHNFNFSIGYASYSGFSVSNDTGILQSASARTSYLIFVPLIVGYEYQLRFSNDPILFPSIGAGIGWNTLAAGDSLGLPASNRLFFALLGELRAALDFNLLSPWPSSWIRDIKKQKLSALSLGAHVRLIKSLAFAGSNFSPDSLVYGLHFKVDRF